MLYTINLKFVAPQFTITLSCNTVRVKQLRVFDLKSSSNKNRLRLKQLKRFIITPNKPILVETKLQNLYLGDVYTQKVRGKLNKSSSINTIGGPFF